MASIAQIAYSWQDQLFVRWLEQTDWPANYKRILRLLFEHQRKHGRVFLFYRTIARWLNISIKTVQRAVRFFVELGLVEVQHRTTQAGDLGSNYFKVIPHILAFPTNDSADDVATPGQSVATPPVSDPPQMQAGQAFPAPVDNANNTDFLKKKINNSKSEEKTLEDTESVVVSSSSNADQDPPLDTLARTLALSPRFVRHLLRKAPRDVVHRLLQWAAACPPHHPARPRSLRAWLMAGARDRWETPPTWVRTTSQKPVSYRVLSEDEIAAKTTPAAPAPDPTWVTVEAFLRSSDPHVPAFLDAVTARLRETMGPELARRAQTSQGPAWRAACCALWPEWHQTLHAAG